MSFDKLNELLKDNGVDINDAVKTISNFQSGKIKPIETSLEHLNKATFGGLIPGMVLSIGARPSMGKTHTLHQLKNDILNKKDRNISMLLYNWEMPWFSLILIQLKKALKKSFHEILHNQPTEFELQHYKDVMEKFRDSRLTTVSKPLTPEEWNYLTREWIEKNLDKEILIVAIDHLGIVVGDDKTKSIYKLMEYENAIKLDYPSKVVFINLFQLNRQIEAIWRAKDTNPVGLRVTSEYIFSADSIMQYSDIVMAQVIPERANMEKYASVNRERYKHLEEHFADDSNTTSEYVRLKGTNRIYYDYIKRRLPEDDESNLYADILNREKEEFIRATSSKERDYTDFDDDELNF
ncbi:MAG: hypothetical protein LBM02_10215 [Lachnospiraceae bacterium]|jgi:replicative DNA helicase|nr:hypothetical protein [Lachnospiraceae bacterium]